MGAMTVDQADELIGKTGKVVNPSKGEWPRKHRCVGYQLDPENENQVKSLRLESVECTERVVTVEHMDHGAQVVKAIEPHPVEVTPACNPRWFRPDDQIITRSAVPAPSVASPSAAAAPAE